MKKQSVKRLVCITGVGAGETKGHGGFLYDHLIFPLFTKSLLIFPLFTKSLYADKDRQEALIRQSFLDWILVRPAVFREGVARGPLRVVTDVQGVTLRRIAPAEVARFVLEQLESDQYLRKMPFLGHA